MATTSDHSPRCIAGITFAVPILAELIMPQRTFSRIATVSHGTLDERMSGEEKTFLAKAQRRKEKPRGFSLRLCGLARNAFDFSELIQYQRESPNSAQRRGRYRSCKSRIDTDYRHSYSSVRSEASAG